MTWRKTLLSGHRWAGLTAGLVVAYMALTGAGFVLRPALDEAVNGTLLTVPACTQSLPLSQLAPVAQAAHPAGHLRSVLVRAAADASIAFKYSDEEMVYLDPCGGSVLGHRNQYGGFFGFAEKLHRFKFLDGEGGRIGRLAAGWCATAFLLLLAVGGLVMWWPQPGQSFKAALKYQPRLIGTARTVKLHKLVGLYCCLFCLMFPLTGIPSAFDTVKNAIGTLTGTTANAPAAPPAVGEAGAPLASLDLLLRQAETALPAWEWLELWVPVSPQKPIKVEIMEPGQPHDDAKSYLFLDSATGQRLSLAHYADLPLGRRIYVTMVMIHSGQIWGLPYKILLLIACLSIGYLAYSGPVTWWRRRSRRPAAATLSLTVARKTLDAEDICVFELADPKGRALPSFSAGSHIDVHIRPGLTRQYSLCNDPRETHRYMLAVMREPQSRGGSRAMHDDLAEGDVIAVSRPKNHFPLAHGATRSLLFAGGIGITPILCMAERLANSGAEFDMHYCTRSPARTAFRQRILASPFAGRVSFHVDDGPPEQKLDLAAVLARPAAGTHLYVCGPKGFMEAVIGTAQRLGWAEEAIHREYFAAGPQTGAAKHPFDLKIASSGRIVPVPAEKSALDALLDHGFEVESSCREGVCGTCQIRVLDGEPDHRDFYLTAEERAKNAVFLPCCSRSRGEALVIDL